MRTDTAQLHRASWLSHSDSKHCASVRDYQVEAAQSGFLVISCRCHVDAGHGRSSATIAIRRDAQAIGFAFRLDVAAGQSQNPSERR